MYTRNQNQFAKNLHSRTTLQSPKQVNDKYMGGTLSVALWHCFKNKIERNIVLTIKPKFYCRFDGETYRWRKKSEPDELFS